jgi:hypothetical protein
MLDAFIIDHIRREREAEKERGSLIPLRIEVPRPAPDAAPEAREDEERGSADIDFQI